MIKDYLMITEKSNRLLVIMITDYDYTSLDPDEYALFAKINILLEIIDHKNCIWSDPKSPEVTQINIITNFVKI